jgi:N-acetylglucosaminyl-diphospho-decaprenol L-rhamnosyltransferase
MSIDVVIVNWNSGYHLRRCLESLAAIGAERELLQTVTVIDNASSDESLDLPSLLREVLPLTVIRNKANLGFAAACNQGAAGTAAEFLLFLNPDVVLQSGCLSAPSRHLTQPEHSRVGMVGIQLLEMNGTIARSCARFPRPGTLLGNILGFDRIAPSLFPRHFLTEWPHDESRKVDQVIGAFLFIRRSVFEQIERFDERFFMYYEDLDLALRAKLQGWSSEYLIEARAVHFGGGTTSGIKGRRMFYACRSRILYCLKHFSLPSAMCVMGATLLLEPAIRIVAAIAKLKPLEAKETLKAFGLLWVDLGEIWSTHYRRREGSGAEDVERV